MTDVLDMTSEQLTAEARRLEEQAHLLRGLMQARRRLERRQRELEECDAILRESHEPARKPRQ
jgi:hypothetical protein